MKIDLVLEEKTEDDDENENETTGTRRHFHRLWCTGGPLQGAVSMCRSGVVGFDFCT